MRCILMKIAHFVFRQQYDSCTNRTFCSSVGHPFFHFSEEVRSALAERRPLVALESTLITHGLAHPRNLETALCLETIVRKEGAIPATIALLDGKVRVGLGQAELERIARPQSGALKVSTRDLANCLAQKAIGGTTVAATMWIANRAGIPIFATGGIGGVHRGAESTMDVSADLNELGRTPVAVVCAGAKSILDICRTLEWLETHGANVVVNDRQSNFPGFFYARTPFRAAHCTDSTDHLADILLISRNLALPGGILIACPLPDHLAAQGDQIELAVRQALAEAAEKGVQGKAVTPFLLHRVAQLSGGQSTDINIALLANNAQIAAQIAVKFAAKEKQQKEMKERMESMTSVGNNNTKINIANGGKTNNKIKRRPKIVCVGAAIVDFEVLRTEKEVSNNSALSATVPDGSYLPSRIVQRAGGVGRNHADALSRLGCQVSFLSALGCDSQGKMDPGAMFLTEKGKHMDWSRVLHCAGQPTATSIAIVDANGAIGQGFISVDHQMSRLSNKYIEENIALIQNADFVLMDANLSVETIRFVFEIAKFAGTRVWVDPTNGLKVPKLFDAFSANPFDKVDILSPNLCELEQLIVNLPLKQHRLHCQQFIGAFKKQLQSCENNNQLLAEKMADWLSRECIPDCLCPLGHLLVTCDKNGVLLISRQPTQAGEDEHYDRQAENSRWTTLRAQFVPPPKIAQEQIVSVSGAGDCFNSGFLCALLNGLGISKSLSVGRECASRSLRSADAVPDSIHSDLHFLDEIPDDDKER